MAVSGGCAKAGPRRLLSGALVVMAALVAVACGGDGGVGSVAVGQTTTAAVGSGASPITGGGANPTTTAGATTSATGAFDEQLKKLVASLVLPEGVPEGYQYPGASVIDIGTTTLSLLPKALNYHAVMCSADTIDKVKAFYLGKTKARTNVMAGRSFTCPSQTEISLTLSAQDAGKADAIAKAKQAHAVNMPPSLLVPTDGELLVAGAKGKLSGGGSGEQIRFDFSYFARDSAADGVGTIARIADAMKTVGLGGKLFPYEGKNSISYQSGSLFASVSASVQPNSATKKDGLMLTYIITAPAS
jgi:hypothetical protein